MSRWADEKANAWLTEHAEGLGYYGSESRTGEPLFTSLAALLDSVVAHSKEECSYFLGARQTRADTLDEVRRIVAEKREAVRHTCGSDDTRVYCCDEILKRLEGL